MDNGPGQYLICGNPEDEVPVEEAGLLAEIEGAMLALMLVVGGYLYGVTAVL